MIESVFNLLADIGYNHPLHPAITHVPVGMIIGGFLFAIFSRPFKKPDLGKAAHYCYILALISVFPTILLGYMDWQHTFEGEWDLLIKVKFFLAAIMVILLSMAVKAGRQATASNKTIAIYFLCLAVAISLGYVGGELVYG